MGTHSSVLAWSIPWTEEPGGLPSMGSQKCWTQTSMHAQHRLCRLCCGGGGAPRDSAGSGATEEGLTSSLRGLQVLIKKLTGADQLADSC